MLTIGCGVLCLFLFWCVLLCVLSSFAIILKRKRELVALLLFTYGCLVTLNVLRLFIMVLWVGLQCVIVVNPDHARRPCIAIRIRSAEKVMCSIFFTTKVLAIQRQVNESKVLQEKNLESLSNSTKNVDQRYLYVVFMCLMTTP